MPGPFTAVGASRGLVPDVLSAGTGDARRAHPGRPGDAADPARARPAALGEFAQPVRSGPDPDPVAAAEKLHGDHVIHVVVDPAAAVHDKPSTLARHVDGAWKILRQGPVTEAAIAAAAV